jgi:hypothetical protein
MLDAPSTRAEGKRQARITELQAMIADVEADLAAKRREAFASGISPEEYDRQVTEARKLMGY